MYTEGGLAMFVWNIQGRSHAHKYDIRAINCAFLGDLYQGPLQGIVPFKVA